MALSGRRTLIAATVAVDHPPPAPAPKRLNFAFLAPLSLGELAFDISPEMAIVPSVGIVSDGHTSARSQKEKGLPITLWLHYPKGEA